MYEINLELFDAWEENVHQCVLVWIKLHDCLKKINKIVKEKISYNYRMCI